MNKGLKKITFIVVILFLSIVILGFIISFLPSKKEKVSTYPQLGINYVNPKVRTDGKVNSLSFPKALPVVTKVFTEIDRDKPAKDIAASFGIEDQYEGIHTQTKLRRSLVSGEEIYTWVDDNKLLTYFLKTGVFEYSGTFAQVDQAVDEQKAKDIVISLLTKNSLLPEDYQVSITYLKLPEFTSSTNDDFSVYRISVVPTINNLPVLTYKNNGQMITFLLNRDLSIFKADYLYISIQSSSQSVNLRAVKTALSEVSKLIVKPSFVDFPSLYPEPDLNSVNITSLEIKNVELVYYVNPKANEVIYPTYKITAGIQTSEGQKGSAVYMVQASE